MAFAASNLLVPVVTALFAAHRGTLDRLAIHHACAGVGISLQANPKALADGPVDPLPSTVDALFSEVVVDGGPSSREVVREQAPLATALQDVEDGV